MTFPKNCIRALATAILLIASAASGVYGSIEHNRVPGDLWTNQMRSTSYSGGLTGNDNYDGVSGGSFQIAWDIVAIDNGMFHYTYAFSGSALAQKKTAVSHFTLDISDDAIHSETLLDGVIVDAEYTVIDDGAATSSVSFNIEAGDKDFITGAVKFDTGDLDMDGQTYIYQFDSTRPPVWGSFFVKSGGKRPDDLRKYDPQEDGSYDLDGGNWAANNALFKLNDTVDDWSFDLNDPMNWIAVPNGPIPVPAGVAPEPASLAVWLGILALGLTGWRFRR